VARDRGLLASRSQRPADDPLYKADRKNRSTAKTQTSVTS
jgi:hypothetical protein